MGVGVWLVTRDVCTMRALTPSVNATTLDRRWASEEALMAPDTVLDQELDSRLFKAFLVAAETLNFTLAARRAHMTQSGVSQHIQRLEEQMRVSLFKRFGRQIVLTDAGRQLVRHLREQSVLTAAFLEEVRADNAKLAGPVSYVMPPTCLQSVHFPLLLEKRKACPEIELNVQLASSPCVEEMIVRRDADFGFINDQPCHPSLQSIPFCQEEYVVVTSDPQQAKQMTPARMPRYRFIVYPGNTLLLERWFQHHCPRTHWRRAEMCAAGSIGQVEGGIVMALHGVGLLAIQRHCIQRQLEAGELHEIRFHAEPLLNSVYIIKLANHLYPRRVEQVITWFIEMSSEEKPRKSRSICARSDRALRCSSRALSS
jgi:LysR family transcriptional regulator, transcriptional activator of the cysJI operon